MNKIEDIFNHSSLETTLHYLGTSQEKPNHIQNPETLLVKLMQMEHTQELMTRQHEAETAKLKHDIRELERDNAALLDLLAQVMIQNSPSLVLREDNFGKHHEFRLGYNLAGEPLLIVVR